MPAGSSPRRRDPSWCRRAPGGMCPETAAAKPCGRECPCSETVGGARRSWGTSAAAWASGVSSRLGERSTRALAGSLRLVTPLSAPEAQKRKGKRLPGHTAEGVSFPDQLPGPHLFGTPDLFSPEGHRRWSISNPTGRLHPKTASLGALRWLLNEAVGAQRFRGILKEDSRRPPRLYPGVSTA